jgi:lipoate-protein ligase A
MAIMRLLDYTAATFETNLALDEALLETAEQSEADCEVLRLWEPHRYAVVVGRSSRVGDEVRLEVCAERDLPVLRRPSGGCAVVLGPGCLMYSVILSLDFRPELRAVDLAHHFVLGQLAQTLAQRIAGVQRVGTSDLALKREHGWRKFSGNSLRIKRRHLLYHGTILYRFPLELIDACLKPPPREPDYRGGRQHRDFVMNLPLPVVQIRQALVDAFEVRATLQELPRACANRLAVEKYAKPEWNLRH